MRLPVSAPLASVLSVLVFCACAQAQCCSSASVGAYYAPRPVHTSLVPVPVSESYSRGGGLPTTCPPCAAPAPAPGYAAGYPQRGAAPVYSYRPMFPAAPIPSGYYFGRGVLGQPKVYVPGQPLRNALRFLTP